MSNLLPLQMIEMKCGLFGKPGILEYLIGLSDMKIEDNSS